MFNAHLMLKTQFNAFFVVFSLMLFLASQLSKAPWPDQRSGPELLLSIAFSWFAFGRVRQSRISLVVCQSPHLSRWTYYVPKDASIEQKLVSVILNIFEFRTDMLLTRWLNVQHIVITSCMPVCACQCDNTLEILSPILQHRAWAENGLSQQAFAIVWLVSGFHPFFSCSCLQNCKRCSKRAQ